MKIKLCVFLALCAFGVRAEQVIYLDQDLVEDAVAEIMRSHGVKSCLKRHVLESACVRRIVHALVGHSDDVPHEDGPSLDFGSEA